MKAAFMYTVSKPTEKPVLARNGKGVNEEDNFRETAKNNPKQATLCNHFHSCLVACGRACGATLATLPCGGSV